MPGARVTLDIGHSSDLKTGGGNLTLFSGDLGSSPKQPLHLNISITDSQLAALDGSVTLIDSVDVQRAPSSLGDSSVEVRLDNGTLTAARGSAQLVGSANSTQPDSPLHMTFDLTQSQLTATDGRVSLVGAMGNNTHLAVSLESSGLDAQGGDATVVHIMGSGNRIALSMNDSNITAFAGADSGSLPVPISVKAAPVGQTAPLASNNRVVLDHCRGNRVRASAQAGPQVWSVAASLGWGFAQVLRPGKDGGGNNTWEQRELEGNLVQAQLIAPLSGSAAIGLDGQVLASLAGYFWYGARHEPIDVDNLPGSSPWQPGKPGKIWTVTQWRLADNQVEAELINTTAGSSTASLGVVGEEPAPSSEGPVLALIQTDCNDNNVTARVPPHSHARARAGLAQVFLCHLKDNDKPPMAAGSACLSGAGPKCSASVAVQVTQCAMENNQLVVDGKSPLASGWNATSGDEQSFLLVLGGCQHYPLSVSGEGVISCTGHSCQESDSGYGHSVTQANCSVLSCGGSEPCVFNATNRSSRAAAMQEATFCENPLSGFVDCGASPLSMAQQHPYPDGYRGGRCGLHSHCSAWFVRSPGFCRLCCLSQKKTSAAGG